MWKCQPNSTWCLEQTQNGTIYNREKMCEENMQLYIDYVWDLKNRTTFAVDYNLLCDNEYLYNLCNTLFFVGAFIALPVGGQVMDVYGRKPVIFVFGLLSAITVIVGSLPSNISNIAVFLLTRTISGGAVMVMYVGVTIYDMEISPIKYRPIACIFICYSWVFGYLLVVASGYFIKKWVFSSLVPLIPLFIGVVTSVFVPESPRFLFNSRNDITATKHALKWYVTINRSDLDVDEMELCETEVEDKTKVTIIENLKAFA